MSNKLDGDLQELCSQALHKMELERLVDFVNIAVGFFDGDDVQRVLEIYEVLRGCREKSVRAALTDPWTMYQSRSLREQLAEGDVTSMKSFPFLLWKLVFAATIGARSHANLEECSIEVPAMVQGNLALPCGLGRISSDLIAGRRLLLNKFLSEVLQAEQRTSRVVAEFEVLFDDPGSFKIPEIKDQRYIDQKEFEAAACGENLISAMELVALHPGSFQLVREFVRTLIPSTGTLKEKHVSASYGSLQGMVALDLSGKIAAIAEALVHEADHQRYYVYSQKFGVWIANSGLAGEFQSPWRLDPRPLDGLLAGASAFAEVSQFYSALVVSGRFDQDCEEFGTRSVHAALQSEDAVNTIREHGKLTPSGQRLVDTVMDRIAASRNMIGGHPNLRSWNDFAQSMLKAHRTEWADLNGQHDPSPQRIS